jgi:hypothetical protein
MANMSYCRFENTLRDLSDCAHHMDDPGYAEAKDKGQHEDEELSISETQARKQLVALCKEILEGVGFEVEGESYV